MSSPVLAFGPQQVQIETPVEHIRRLEQEARSASLAEKDDLLRQLQEDAARCLELAEVESLPAGLREAIRGIGAGIEIGLQSAQAVAVRNAG